MPARARTGRSPRGDSLHGPKGRLEGIALSRLGDCPEVSGTICPRGEWQLKRLEIRGTIAELAPDTDPRSVGPALAAAERVPRLQFTQQPPAPLLEAAAAAVAADPSMPVRFYSHSHTSSLDFLSAFAQVRHLSVEVWHATDLAPLGSFTELESLGIGQTKSHATSLGFLRSLRKLTDLWIEGHDRDFDAVGELPQLRRLSLRASRARSLVSLAGHRNLTTLEMDFGGIRDLGPLIDVPGLRGLGLYQVRKFDTADLAVLGQLPKLEALSLGALRNVERLSLLDGRPAKTLRCLTLERLLALRTLEEIGVCDALEELYLDIEARPADRLLSPLLGAPSLKYVHVGGVFPREQVEALRAGFRGRTLTYRNDLLCGSRDDRGVLSWRGRVADHIT